MIQLRTTVQAGHTKYCACVCDNLRACVGWGDRYLHTTHKVWNLSLVGFWSNGAILLASRVHDRSPQKNDALVFEEKNQIFAEEGKK